jgi:hypothetical protein
MSQLVDYGYGLVAPVPDGSQREYVAPPHPDAIAAENCSSREGWARKRAAELFHANKCKPVKIEMPCGVRLTAGGELLVTAVYNGGVPVTE